MITTALLIAFNMAASDPALSLSGTVVDAQGAAVPGAMIVVAEGPPALRFMKRLARSATPKAPDVLGHATTDASGKFTVSLPDETPEVGWRRWRLTVWTYHPGFGLSVRLIDRDWPRAGLPLSLALTRDVRARLKITDSQGRPVAGAQVRPQRVAGQPMPAMLAERLAAVTDADGFAIVAGAATDDLEAVAVESEAGGAQWAAVPRLGADNSATIALAPIGRLVGRLTADDPRAARRRKLRFATWQALDDDNEGGGLADAITDEDGRFEVSAIAAGSLTFEVDEGDEPVYLSSQTTGPQVEPGKTATLDIPLRRAVLVTQEVRDRDDKAPIAGARISWHWGRPGGTSADSDASGRLRGHLLPGQVTPMPIRADADRP